MRCRNCDHTLWNLPEPRCPECGVGFDIRSYNFKANTVAFACPHCGHLHAGTGVQYLPSLADEAVCRGCQQTMQVAAMPVVPLTDDAEATAGNPLPYEHRGDLGFWRAWWRTCTMVMLRPTAVGKAITPTGRFATAYSFAALTHLLAALGFFLFFSCTLVGFGAVMGMVSGWGLPGVYPGLGLGLIGFQFVFVLLAAVLPLLLVVFVAGPAHLFLVVTGGSRSGFRVTVRSIMYAQGPIILGALPLVNCLGNAGAIWALIAGIFVLKESQGVSGARATWACLWFPLALIGLAVAGIVLVSALEISH